MQALDFLGQGDLQMMAGPDFVKSGRLSIAPALFLRLVQRDPVDTGTPLGSSFIARGHPGSVLEFCKWLHRGFATRHPAEPGRNGLPGPTDRRLGKLEKFLPAAELVLRVVLDLLDNPRHVIQAICRRAEGFDLLTVGRHCSAAQLIDFLRTAIERCIGPQRSLVAGSPIGVCGH